jgi:ferrochelatase
MTVTDAVLLVAFGGPERTEDVRPFLANVLRGRPVPPERLEEVVHHYERIGGRSPLNELTFRQARALAAALRAEGTELPVYVGMRNWSPYLAETLTRLRDDGRRRVLAVILAAHRTEASWERYTTAIDAACDALGAEAPVVEYGGRWFAHPEFVAAVAGRTRAALATIGDETCELVFTAHSIPRAMAEASPYVAELTTSCRLVADALGRSSFSIAYQSRSGNPREPWLEPDVNDVLRGLPIRGVHAAVLVPIGFVCDHVEVLYDLDVEARATADQAGVRLARAEAVNDDPAFIRVLLDVVRSGIVR